jgi:L-rhamnonate dehydratase
LIDVIQYDVRSYEFTSWLELGEHLDQENLKAAPHNYGSSYGNYVLCHLLTAIDGFQFVEWDEIKVFGMDASDYKVKNGKVIIPSIPGFGLNWDHNYLTKMAKENGWSLQRSNYINRIK